MNRKMRRKKSKQQRREDRVYAKAEELSKDASAYALMKSVDIMFAASLMVLRDKFDFGEVRAKRFKEHFEELFVAISEGYLSPEDVLDTVESELNINISGYKKLEKGRQA